MPTARVTHRPEMGLIEIDTDPPTKIPLTGSFRMLHRGAGRGRYTSLAMNYPDVIARLGESGFEVVSSLKDKIPLRFDVKISGETGPTRNRHTSGGNIPAIAAWS